jgi:polygalacturonase
MEAQNSLEQLPFAMPNVNIPNFKTDTFNVKTYGAVNDGITINTEAFAKTIEACSNSGGGTVLIPEGLWLTGPIVLKSNINLHAAQGALVIFSQNLNDYPLVDGYYEGLKSLRCQSPISGRNLTNIAITGKGIFDGSGQVWRMVKKSKVTDSQWKALVNSGGVVSDDKLTWYPSEKSKKGNTLPKPLNANSTREEFEAVKDFLRPVMVSLIECKNILLEGPSFRNSPSWCIHPLMCEHLTVRNINVFNPWNAQNGDAIDVESCRIGTITNCVFDAGDDAICIKSGRNDEGRKRGMPTEFFVVKNCTVYNGHGGFVIGSEMSGGVRNMFVSNCTFIGTDIGLRFKSTRGRGGIVENIWISDISMINIPAEAISFNMYYGGTSPVPEADEVPTETVIRKPTTTPAVDEGTPIFRNFYIKNIACNGAALGILSQGLPEMPIRNIQFENISMKTTEGIDVIDAENISFKNVKIEIAKKEAINIDNSSNISFKGISAKVPESSKLVTITGNRTNQIQLSEFGPKLTEQTLFISNEVKADAVKK